MTTHPFTFSELRHLLEYLDGHAATPQSIYSIRFWTPVNDSQAVDESAVQLIKIKVRGSQGIRHISDRPGVQMDRIIWRNRDSIVTLNCARRELLIETASLSFIEICRHKLIGQNVGKIMVDLKPR